jgi:toxin ParE1/3/4
MKIRFTQTAINEINDIFSYVAERNPAAALAVISEIDRTIARLARFPEMGHPKYKPDIRALPVGRFRRYLVFYTIAGDEVVILNVRHGARRQLWEMREEL